MALVRGDSTGERTLPTARAPRPAGRPYLARAYAELPPPVGMALRAVRLEAQLGDPADPANRYGLPALSALTGPDGPPPPADLRAEFLAPEAGGHFTGAAELARVLRPLLCRDLALGHTWATRPLSGPGGDLRAAGGRETELAALLGPFALIAATGRALRTAVGIVDGLGADPAARQWHGTLAGAFADLLACESLTTVALRCLVLPAEATAVLGAAVGHVVPQLAADILGDLELVLNESGLAPASLQQRTLAKLTADLAAAPARWPGAAGCRDRLVTALPDLAAPGQVPAAAGGVLFGLGEAVAVPAGLLPAGTGCHHVLADALAGAAAARPAEGHGALARLARRLRTERRTLHLPSLTAADAVEADAGVWALADRQALLLLAGAVLGVHRAAQDGTFLAAADWALLALVRVTERLGVPLPPLPADPRTGVWAHLAERGRRGLDCDVYATKTLW
ncbi:hypothetical protein [Streptomyces brasiliensis]|uniref:Uncharacterized protein n=1 Tax=Streptomyces brasiliensis TaxID=1954 RepID=A0A917L5V9_9ACTN|nr:hypothetical protein [Streptomyces brasiliensis]GGJ44511.1 hypothetical protein GCM10010121_064640 [Streptomyces brasiliensis]